MTRELNSCGDLVLRGTDRTVDCDGTGEELGLNDRIACIGADHNAKFADAYPRSSAMAWSPPAQAVT